MSKLAQDINSVSAELFVSKLAQDINTVDAELLEESTPLMLTAPANGEVNVTVSTQFTWTDSDNRDVYKLVYDTDVNFTNPTTVWTESLSYTVESDLTASTTYYWYVEAHTAVQQPAIPTGTIQDDSEAGDIESLQLFYDNLGGASWTDNTGWASTGMTLDTAPFGITTAEINGETRVTELNLVANNLIGTIPEFPGLQECTVFFIKQAESGSATPPTRITGEIPSSLGQTKISELSLSGRRPDDYRSTTGNFYNKKNGKAWNQFSGSLPPELYNLTLTFFEIDGLDGQFNGTLDSRCGNWRLDRFFATGNIWYSDANDPPLSLGSFSGELPSEIKNWDSQIFLVEDNSWSGIALDAFEGWTEKSERWIMTGNDGGDEDWYWTQELPTITFGNFAKFSWRNRQINGPFPTEFFQGIGDNRLYEFEFNTHDFSGSVTPGLLANFGNTLRFSLGRNSTEPMNLTGELFGQNENASGYFLNNIILFYTQSNRFLESYIPEGMHEWTETRYIFMQDMSLKGTLPPKPPAMFSPTLRSLRFERRSDKINQYTGGGLTGSIPADWGQVGSAEIFGGELATGTITGFGEDATGFYIEDSNASYTVDEFKPDNANTTGPLLRHPASSSNKLRKVVSNTATRIYYEGFLLDGNLIPLTNLANGNEYQIKRNPNTDLRPLDGGINLSNHNLSGTLLAEAAPEFMSGGTYNIEGNKFTVKDFVDNISVWIDLATNTTGDAVMSAAAVEGDMSIFIDDGAGGASTNTISAGDYIFIDDAEHDRYIVDTIVGNEITFTRPLRDSYPDNTNITNGWNFAYANQQKFGENQPDIDIEVGDFFEINFSEFATSGADYTWYFEGVATADIAPTLQRNNAQESDSGIYRLEITHPDVPNMTSISIDVTVTVTPVE